MIRYAAYLETGIDRQCMAHVLSLPGCMLRAENREEALRRLPDAIRDHQDWLRWHGKMASPRDELVEVEIVEESSGFGPFDPGDAAALFLPDRQSLTLLELEDFFCLLNCSRIDLLALVNDLPESVMDWQPDPASFSIRRILRHIGNAEEWYVSRLVPPETLPPEWEQDEQLPIFEFLEMERRMAVARLRSLTEVERSKIFFPEHWTQHPQEPWTARKAMRRFMEHEREHTVQIRELLDSYAKKEK